MRHALKGKLARAEKTTGKCKVLVHKKHGSAQHLEADFSYIYGLILSKPSIDAALRIMATATDTYTSIEVLLKVLYKAVSSSRDVHRSTSLFG